MISASSCVSARRGSVCQSGFTHSVFKARIPDGNSKLLGIGNVGGVSGVVISLRVNDKAVFVSFAHEQQARDAVRRILLLLGIELTEKIIVPKRIRNKFGIFRRRQLYYFFNLTQRQIEIRLLAF